MKWEATDFGWEIALEWRSHDGVMNGRVWIENRPPYCDRGRYIVATDLPLDSQEGWPRYFFDIDRAKDEIYAWIAGRNETHYDHP